MINDDFVDVELIENEAFMYIQRYLDLKSVLKKKSCFLLGPRQTGKSKFIQNQVPEAPSYSLLHSDTFRKLNARPEILRQEASVHSSELIVIDEIQLIPELLNEVHILIEDYGKRFLLTGSSARKLHRKGVNLLGGRARTRRMHPLVSVELNEAFDLNKALNYGTLPSIWTSDSPEEDLAAYIGDYLQIEIASESAAKNIPAFTRFLEVAALCNSQMINLTQIASDAEVPRTTLYEYYQILKDTLIAEELPAWQESKKRKAITTSKNYFFDAGVVRAIQGRAPVKAGTPEYGDFFETYIFHELKSYLDYELAGSGSLHYWRSTSKMEVDFILNENIAIEVKAKKQISENDLKGLKAIAEENKMKAFYLVAMVDTPRKQGAIHILPWKEFFQRLWSGEIT